MIHLKNISEYCRPGLLLALLVIVSLFVVGCVSTNSTVELSREVSDVFESGKIIPGYDYYYSGPAIKPIAIVAISKEIVFEKGFWMRVNMEQSPPWPLGVTNFYRTRNRYFGSYVLDLSGRRVGLWYSEDLFPIIFWGDDNKKVKIQIPTIWDSHFL